MENFHFLRPWALLAILPLVVALIRMLRHRRGPGPWSQVCDPALWPHVLVSRHRAGARVPWHLILAALLGALAVVALAGPAWRELPQPLYRDETALVILLDVSRSMDARDLEPSRLERAKHKVRDVLAGGFAGENALVVYAAHAFAVTPLTEDADTIESLLDSIGTDIAPVQGSRPSLAMERASELLEQGASGRGSVLLVSDGFDDAGAQAAARALAAAGIPLSVIAVGTDGGAPIPLGGGGFLTDGSGAVVVPRLMAAELASLADAAGGRFSRLTADDSDLEQIFSAVMPSDAALGDMVGQAADRWREEGPWLLLLALPFAALAFRKGWLALLVPAVIGLQAAPAGAADWRQWWLTPDQQGRRALAAGHAEQAAKQFADPAWKAAALYRAGHFQESADILEGIDSAAAHYNRGNSLARLGSYEEALAAYEQALKADPDHQDAEFNRELVREQLPEPPPTESQGEQNGQPGDDEEADGQEQRQSAGDGGDPREGDAADSGQDAADREQSQAGGSRQKGERPEEEEQPSSDSDQSQDAAADAATKSATSSSDSEESTEQDRSRERLLSLVPDAPGELLRRKFRHQYRRAYDGQDSGVEPW